MFKAIIKNQMFFKLLDIFNLLFFLLTKTLFTQNPVNFKLNNCAPQIYGYYFYYISFAYHFDLSALYTYIHTYVPGRNCRSLVASVLAY